MRSQALDEFRGLSMILLTILSPLFLFDAVPAWLKHAPKTGLHIADIVAPMFLFAIGISYRISLRKKLTVQPTGTIVKKVLKRYGIFILFGLCGELLVYDDMTLHWGVLETIGLTGIFVLPLMLLSWAARLTLALALPMLWQIALIAGYAPHALSYDVGGPLATPAWASFMLSGSVMGEFLESSDIYKAFSHAIPLLTGSWLLACVSSFAIPISKPLVSLSYVAAGTACAVTIFLFFILKEYRGIPCRFLEIFGKNSLAMYIIAGFECLTIRNIFPSTISLIPALSISIVAIAISTIHAFYLDGKKIYFKI